jgi:hypothetical protein
VTVEDNTDPTALCQDITVELNQQGVAAISAGDINDGSFDNCGIISLSLSDSTFVCNDIGPNLVTLTATDGSNNTSSCNAIVTVEDNIAPMAVCQNAGIQLNANGIAILMGSQVDGGSTDNCEIDEIKPVQTTFTCANIGVNMVQVIVTDGSGNSSSCTATITVFDLLPPVAECKDVIVQLSPAGTFTLSPSAVDDGTTDNCSFTLSLDVAQFSCADVGLHVVTLTATDGSGNIDTCTANVTVLASAACPAPDITNSGGQT